MRLVRDAQPEQPQRPTGAAFARARAARAKERVSAARHNATTRTTSAPSTERVREVTGETVHAANAARGLSDQDVRMVFAQQVFANLDGGRAAILRPERRRALVAWGTARGLRPFDANLVIAIVQDAARRGEVLASLGALPVGAAPAPRCVTSALVLIPEPATTARREAAARLLVAGVLAAFLLASLLLLLSR